MPGAFTEYDPEQGFYVVKTKARYRIEKLVEGQWTLMAHVPEETEGFEPLCQALGGKIRVEDVKQSTGSERSYVIERDFE